MKRVLFSLCLVLVGQQGFASECQKILYPSSELSFDIRNQWDGNNYFGFVNIDNVHACDEGTCFDGRMTFRGFGTNKVWGYYNETQFHMARECPACRVGTNMEQHYNGYCAPDRTIRGDFADADGTVRMGTFTFKRN